MGKSKLKKLLFYVLFPFVLLWMTVGTVIMYIGDGIHWLGNAMTGFKADKSIGKVYSK